jgi:hypothetical protein
MLAGVQRQGGEHTGLIWGKGGVAVLVKIIVILIPILITIIIIQLLLILILRLIIINSYSKIIIIIIIPTTQIMIRSGPNWTPTITPNTHLNQAQTGHQP